MPETEDLAAVAAELERRRRLLAVARGDADADLVLTGGRVFSAWTREWLSGDVGIVDGTIAGVGSFAGGERIHVGGAAVVPGFIDAHVHIESSKLTPAEFARVVVPRGTTAVVVDPHEIANVLGLEGVRWFQQACAGLPLDVLIRAPANVPASALESPRGPLTPEEVAALALQDDVVGVAEMMNFPAVVAGDPDELRKLVLARGRTADGHAPGLEGSALDAYVAAGIHSDHEATTVGEALAKRRRGLWVLLREASNAHNLLDLLPLVAEHGPERVAFCTDDREPTSLQDEGHLDHLCRLALGAQIALEDVLLLASTHPARCHGLGDRGAITPGARADLVVLPDAAAFRPSLVLKGGRVVARDGVAEPFATAPVPGWVRSTVAAAPLGPDDLALPAAARARVVDLVPGQLLTGAGEASPLVVDGASVADPARDLAKLCVVERHHATGRVGVGLVRGFGLRAGAFASTVAHDAHNIVGVGIDDPALRACVARLGELGGGLVVADGAGVVVAELALPVAGLMSDAPAAEVADGLRACERAVAALGVTVEEPFMALSFLALSVIPDLKLTDRGLVDVVGARVVPFALA